MPADELPSVEAAERPKQRAHTVWFINSHATSIEPHLPGYQDRYEEESEHATWIDTTADDECIDKLCAALAEHSEEEIELIVGGGDGTLHKAINALMAGVPPEVLAKLTVVDVGLGGENDFAHMLHGANFDNLDTIRESRTWGVRPLLLQKQNFRIVGPEGEGDKQPGDKYYYWDYISTAAYSFGMGTTAVGAALANRWSYKQLNAERPDSVVGRATLQVRRWMANVALAGQSLLARRYRTHQGRRKDLTIVNGDRLGGTFLYPARLENEGFYVSETKNMFYVLPNLGDMLLLGVGHGGIFVKGYHNFDITEPTLVHLDGETYTLEPGHYKISEGRVPISYRAALAGLEQGPPTETSQN